MDNAATPPAPRILARQHNVCEKCKLLLQLMFNVEHRFHLHYPKQSWDAPPHHTIPHHLQVLEGERIRYDMELSRFSIGFEARGIRLQFPRLLAVVILTTWSTGDRQVPFEMLPFNAQPATITDDRCSKILSCNTPILDATIVLSTLISSPRYRCISNPWWAGSTESRRIHLTLMVSMYVQSCQCA